MCGPMGMRGKTPYPPIARWVRISAIRTYAYGPVFTSQNYIFFYFLLYFLLFILFFIFLIFMMQLFQHILLFFLEYIENLRPYPPSVYSRFWYSFNYSFYDATH